MPDNTHPPDGARSRGLPVEDRGSRAGSLRALGPDPPPNNLPLRAHQLRRTGEGDGRGRGLLERHPLADAHRTRAVAARRGSPWRWPSELAEEFEDGVWLVELASLVGPCPRAPGRGLGPGRSRAAGPHADRDALGPSRSRQMLLVLDNCEHLVEACAELAEALLRSCPELRILATSREALGITGEVAWPVPSLSLPDLRHLPAVESLPGTRRPASSWSGRWRSSRTFTLTEQNAASVAQICYRLDGIPLAIELAAARAKVLSVEQIAARLDDSFRLLATGSRTAMPRHQTLHATMDWSHELLPDEERTLFRRLSVFAGGFALEAAESVCAGEDLERARGPGLARAPGGQVAGDGAGRGWRGPLRPAGDGPAVREGEALRVGRGRTVPGPARGILPGAGGRGRAGVEGRATGSMAGAVWSWSTTTCGRRCRGSWRGMLREGGEARLGSVAILGDTRPLRRRSAVDGAGVIGEG